MITQVFGQDAGLNYLEGLRLQFQGSSGDEKAESSPSKSQKTTPKKRVAPPKKVIQKVKKTRVRVKTKTTPPPQNKSKDPAKGKSTMQMIASGLS
jgi:hypothetical protein